MINFAGIFVELFAQVTKAVTGQLFTDEQIKRMTSHSVGKYFSDLFPDDENEATQRERIETAHNHIVKATSIMSDMRTELDAQKETLETLLSEIDDKKSTAERYE